MASNEVIECPLGVRTSRTLTIGKLAGSPPGDPVGYTWADTPYSLVWSGDDQPAITAAAPSVAWLDPVNCVVIVDVSVANTAALATPGTYRCQIRIQPDDGGDPILAAKLLLKLTAAPGAAATPPTYGTFQGMLDLAPWVAQVADDEDDRAGLADQRSAAFRRLNRHVADWYADWYQRSGRFYWPAWATVTLPTPAGVRLALDAGGLIATPRATEIATWDAISLIGGAQVTKGSPNEDPFAVRGMEAALMRDQLLMGFIAEIDLSSPLDGVADISVAEGRAWPAR